MADANALVPPKLVIRNACEIAGSLTVRQRLSAEYIIEKIKNDEIFINSQSYRDQCWRLDELFRSDPRNVIPYSHLSMIFKPRPHKSSIQQQIEKKTSYTQGKWKT